MLQAAYDYVQSQPHRPNRNLDLLRSARERLERRKAAAGKRCAMRFCEFKQSVRFHLLAYPDVAAGNLSVRVTGVRRESTSDGAELFVSVHLAREGGRRTRSPCRCNLKSTARDRN